MSLPPPSLLFLTTLLTLITTITARSRSCLPPYDSCSFVDSFKIPHSRWNQANNYANGVPFAAWWSSSRVNYDNPRSALKISVSRNPKFNKPFAAGQIQTKQWYGYGCFEVRVKPARQSGLITTFFSYTGRYDAAPGASRKHNEVDIEFVERRIGGQLRLVMQCNYFTEGLGGHEKFITLPFEPENEFHNYAFKWTKRYIKWFVDGKLVHTAFNNLPKLPHGPHKIMMNVWPVQPAAQNWAGTFNYQSVKTSTYAAVRFSRGENCKIENSFP